MPRRSTFLALALTLVAATAAAATPTLRIGRGTPAPLHDLGERAPETAGTRVIDFRQREPNDGAPVTLNTSAEISYDNDRLYVTFVCDADPAQIRAHLGRREDIGGDDMVTVWLDTFHDGHHAYVFYANPLGVQLDGLVTEGQDDDFSFDTVWDSEGRVTATGYVVRMSIPFRSLRYANGAVTTWGIALGRSIPSRAELSTWPLLTSTIDAFVPQFASLAGLERLPQRRSVDVTPFATGLAARVSNPEAGGATASAADQRVGVDAKVVLGRDWTIDATVHPDFSQVESDEPQVTVNQRYEVYFPEKRPFFTDRAGFFQTPERVFFSRRVVDPALGLRFTGVAAGWTVGSLVVEDAASATLGERGRAASAIARAQRAFRGDSYWGATASFLETTSGRTNRLLSVDTRTKLTPNWIVTAQAIQSETSDEDGARSGLALFGEIRHAGRHLNYYSNYRDRTPDFAAPLGFITRVDMRQMKHVIGYRWKPTHGPLVGIGPSMFTLANWDHAGTLQESSIDVPLWLDFKGPASIAIGRTRGNERYRGTLFERDSTYAYASTGAVRWLNIDASISRGAGINYYPSQGFPTGGATFDSTAGLTLRPSARVQIANTFVFSRLAANGQTIYQDRYVRTKASLQVTREWSIRAITELHRLDIGPLYAGTPDRRLTFDFLTTYLVHPGSALYVGFTDRTDDVPVDASAVPVPLAAPPSVTSRQFFVKLTRTLSF